MLYYTVFRTKWGYFALAGMPRDAGARVVRTSLPVPARQTAERELLASLTRAYGQVRPSGTFLHDLRQRIIAYFEGENVDFSTDPAVSLTALTPFAQRVLLACRTVPFARTTTYAGLAAKLGRPGAARAVGNALARNPIPLVIPCHRILRTDGGLGGFSAPGGTATKRRLLRHEQSALPRNPAVSPSDRAQKAPNAR